MIVVDTNILLDYPQILEEKEQIVILTDVLKELEGLKINPNSEVSYKARRAAVMLSRRVDSIEWDLSMEQVKMPVDDKILEVAKRRNSTLITNDVYLKVKAKVQNVDTHGYGNDGVYTGIKYLTLELDKNKQHPILEKILNSGEILPEIGDVNEGQYLIVRDGSDSFKNKFGETEFAVLGIFIVKDGKLEKIDEPHKHRIYNSWTPTNKGIGPRNAEQECLFHALNNPNISILYAGGAAGRGKSFIVNNYALQELERGHINKIVYIPNNAYVNNTLEVGTLPGELLPKVAGQLGPLMDLIGIDKIQELMQLEQLEVVPMSSLRGRSFDKSIIIVNEAQNLTEDHVKLLVSRVGEGTRIFYDGDLQQSDAAIYKNKNGLKLLLNLRKSPLYSKMFAAVKLQLTERSLTAHAASFLDKYTGNFEGDI